MNWDTYEPAGDPRIVVARRTSTGKLDAHRVNVHQDAFEVLRQIAEAALAQIRERIARPYAPFGQLEDDEYFSIDVEDVPQRPGDQRLKDPTPSPASAIDFVRLTDEHPLLEAGDLTESRLDLYAIVYINDDDYVGFLRKTSPKTSLEKGKRYFEFGDTLRYVDHPPDLVLDDTVDLIIASDEIAILNANSFQVLFGDVHIATQNVDQHLQSLSTQFADSAILLSAQSLETIRVRCRMSVRYAMRLYYLATERAGLLNLGNAAAMTANLETRGLSHLLDNDEFAIADDSVSDFFDWLEGRLFADDHTGQERRADRFSSR